jgi:hypothetical protein
MPNDKWDLHRTHRTSRFLNSFLYRTSQLSKNGNIMDSYTRVGVIIGITLLTTLGATLIQQVYAKAIEDGAQRGSTSSIKAAAPVATSGNNVYVSWWNNKTGNDEVMFKVSTDGGKTFADKMI